MRKDLIYGAAYETIFLLCAYLIFSWGIGMMSEGSDKIIMDQEILSTSPEALEQSIDALYALQTRIVIVPIAMILSLSILAGTLNYLGWRRISQKIQPRYVLWQSLMWIGELLLCLLAMVMFLPQAAAWAIIALGIIFGYQNIRRSQRKFMKKEECGWSRAGKYLVGCLLGIMIIGFAPNLFSILPLGIAAFGTKAWMTDSRLLTSKNFIYR